MNAKIIAYLKDIISKRETNYKFISIKTGIDYQRLMRVFNQNAVISGSELICLCKVLEINQIELMALIDNVQEKDG